MKKLLILAGVITFALSATSALASDQTQTPKKEGVKKECPKRTDCKKMHKRPNLDEALSLTEAQKVQAKEIRMKGHEKIKPVIDQIKAKKEEMKTSSETDKAAKTEELKKLKMQAREIRRENMKEFEAILTPEQKTKFEQIKKEGRENFKKHHKHNGQRPHTTAK